MEPISLRAITTLLNYERVTSDPRFQNVGLLKWSFADDDMIELIFHETRGHSGCFKAIGLYGIFFELCPPNQKIAIQITNEPPLIVDASSAKMIGFNVVGPRLRTMTTIPSAPLVTTTGFESAECHSIVGFSSINGTSPYTVVDMTRMQYGAVGCGEHGEVYFIGPLVDYRASMQHICANLASFYELPMPIPEGDDPELATRLRECANRGAGTIGKWKVGATIVGKVEKI